MLSISNETMSAFREKADASLVQAISAWAKEQIPWALDTQDPGEIEKRIKACMAFGRRHGLQTQRELALLFGALSALGPHWAGDSRFRDSLSSLAETQRLAFLYDLLTGSLIPNVSEGNKPQVADWESSLQ